MARPQAASALHKVLAHLCRARQGTGNGVACRFTARFWLAAPSDSFEDHPFNLALSQEGSGGGQSGHDDALK